MSDTEINVAIAEACGIDVSPETWETARTSPYRDGSIEEHLGISEYCTDLNAMHEVEMTLTCQQKSDYFDALFHVLPCDENHGPMIEDGEDVMTPSPFAQIHATARQRAEAFLRTIGKWKD